jgi:hypothetical protein
MLFLIIYDPVYTCFPHIGPVKRFVEKRNAYMLLVGKPEGKRPPGRPAIKWGDNIKMCLWEIGCEGVHWIDLAKNRNKWLGCCVRHDEPSGFVKCGEFSD